MKNTKEAIRETSQDSLKITLRSCLRWAYLNKSWLTPEALLFNIQVGLKQHSQVRPITMLWTLKAAAKLKLLPQYPKKFVRCFVNSNTRTKRKLPFFSYDLLTNLLWFSYRLLCNFVWTSYELITNFLWTFYKHLNNFLWTYYYLFTNFLQTFYKLLMNFLQTSYIFKT